MGLPPVATRGAGLCRPARGCLCGCGGWGVWRGGWGQGRPTHPGRAPGGHVGVDEAEAPAFPSEKPSLPPSGASALALRQGALLGPGSSHSEAVPAPSGASTPALQILSACGDHSEGRVPGQSLREDFLSVPGRVRLRSTPPLRSGKGEWARRKGREEKLVPAEESGSERPVTGSNQGLEEALGGFSWFLG